MEPTARYPVLILISETNVNERVAVSKTCVILLQDASMLTEVLSFLYIFLFRQLTCVNDSLELASVLDHILNCIKHFNDSDSL